MPHEIKEKISKAIFKYDNSISVSTSKITLVNLINLVNFYTSYCNIPQIISTICKER